MYAMPHPVSNMQPIRPVAGTGNEPLIVLRLACLANTWKVVANPNKKKTDAGPANTHKLWCPFTLKALL